MEGQPQWRRPEPRELQQQRRGVVGTHDRFDGADVNGDLPFRAIPNLGKLLGTPVWVGGLLIDTASFEYSGVIDAIQLK